MSKKKRNPKSFADEDYYLPVTPKTREEKDMLRRVHVGVDIHNLTVPAQRRVLGLKPGQLTPKEAMHG